MPVTLLSATELLQGFGVGLALGFSIAAPPGPINATIASQVAAKSWLAGFLVGLGAITADAIFFAVTYLGVTGTAVEGEASSVLLLAGGLIMLFMSYSTIRHGRSRLERRAVGTRLPYLVGLSIGITNPFQIGWWLTVGVGVLATLGLRVLLGFFSGITAWVLIYSSALTWAMRRYYRVYPFVLYLSAVCLALFGIWFVSLALFGVL